MGWQKEQLEDQKGMKEQCENKREWRNNGGSKEIKETMGGWKIKGSKRNNGRIKRK